MHHLTSRSALFYFAFFVIFATHVIISTAPARADEYTDWCWQNPRTTQNDLWGVSVVDKNIIWIAGYYRTILKTVDGGTNWSIQDAPTSYNLTDISAVDANTAWAVGGGYADEQVILKTADGGETWTIQTNPTGTLMMSVSAVDANTVWAVGWNGKIIKTTDGGQNWIEQTSPTTAPLMSVFAVDESTAWAVGTNDGVHGTMIKTANGVDWTIQNPGTTGHLSGVTAISRTHAWAVGSDKALSSTAIITRTTDGVSWTSQSILEGGQLKGVSAADETHAWAVSNYGSLFATTDGDTWVQQTPPNSASLNGVCVFDTQTAWAVGNYGTVIRTTNGGATWRLLSSEMDLVINNTDIKMVDNTTGWVVGYENGSVWGRIYKTTDAGFSWTRQDTDHTITHLYALTAVNGSTAWATGYKGYTWKTTDGQTWIQQVTPTESGMSGISAADKNTVWQVGGGGLIWKTESGGAFTVQLSPTGYDLRAVHALSPTKAYVVGENGTILKTTTGTSWSLQTISPPTIDHFNSVFAIDANTAWAVGTNGIIYKTTDGANWNQQTSPTGITLNKIWAFDSNNAWAVGFEGTIIRTTNGTDWTIVPSIVHNRPLNGLTGVKPDCVWAVGMFGAIVHTYLIGSINPTQGPQGRLITINGSGFGATQGSSYVYFGGVQASGFRTWSDSRITCFVPAGVPAGAIDLWVQTPWGMTKKQPFTVDALAEPYIDTLTPASGPVGQEVTISGTGFGLRTDGSPPYVTFGSTQATTYISWSDIEIKAVVPAGASGSVQVNVHTAGGTSNYQIFTVVQQFGSLMVTIGPQGAIDAGGQWRRTGTTTWRASGYTETGLTPGSYTVEFRIVPGWNTKTNETVTVQAGQTFMLTVAYTQNTTQYQVSVSAAGEGSTVIGGGGYVHNSWVTLTAVPQKGYAFSHWTENGQVVAGARGTYSFYATYGRTLVANFREIKPLPGVLIILLGE